MHSIVRLGVRCILPTLLVSLVALASGCGGAGYPVEGKVQWQDGTPATELASGIVRFEPVTGGSAEGVGPSAEIKADGSFQTHVKKAGKYRVAVVPLVQVGTGTGKAVPLMDPRFQDMKKSGIEVDLTAGKNEGVVIKVEKNKTKPKPSITPTTPLDDID
jgi:hypothetical protein